MKGYSISFVTYLSSLIEMPVYITVKYTPQYPDKMQSLILHNSITKLYRAMLQYNSTLTNQ